MNLVGQLTRQVVEMTVTKTTTNHHDRFNDRDPFGHHHDHDHLHGGGHPPGGVDGERCGVEGGWERDRGGDYPDHKQHHHHNKPGNIAKII